MLRLGTKISAYKRVNEPATESNQAPMTELSGQIPIREYFKNQKLYSKDRGGKSMLKIKMDQVLKIDKSLDRTLSLTPTEIRNLGLAQNSGHVSSLSIAKSQNDSEPLDYQ